MRRMGIRCRMSAWDKGVVDPRKQTLLSGQAWHLLTFALLLYCLVGHGSQPVAVTRNPLAHTLQSLGCFEPDLLAEAKGQALHSTAPSHEEVSH